MGEKDKKKGRLKKEDKESEKKRKKRKTLLEANSLEQKPAVQETKTKEKTKDVKHQWQGICQN